METINLLRNQLLNKKIESVVFLTDYVQIMLEGGNGLELYVNPEIVHGLEDNCFQYTKTIQNIIKKKIVSVDEGAGHYIITINGEYQLRVPTTAESHEYVGAIGGVEF